MSQVTVEKLERLIKEYEEQGLPSEELEGIRHHLSELKRGGRYYARKANNYVSQTVHKNGVTEVYISTTPISSEDLKGVGSKKV